MVYQATQTISERFEEASLRYEIHETEHFSLLECTMVTRHTTLVMRFLSSDDSNGVNLRVSRAVRFPQAKRAEVLRLVNALNCEFRFVKFVVNDTEHSVDVLYDFPRSTADAGETAMELIGRVPDIVDEAYPRLMRTIWG